jgi:hypothetical protein
MDGHAQQAVGGTVRAALRAGTALAGLVLALASGCANTGQLMTALTGEKPAPPVAQVGAMWGEHVITGVDPAHAGAPMYGLIGRVYLWPADMKQNLLADGKLVVELYATPPEQPQAPPVRMELWEIKKDVLNSVNLRTDGGGPGYSLSLPWPSYRPDITQVYMRVRYEPERGMPVESRSPLALNAGPVGQPVVSKRTETGNGQPVVTAAPPQTGTPPRGPVLPAGGPTVPGALQPVSGTQVPGGVQLQPAVGAQPQVSATPPAGQFAPACTIQPASGMPAPVPPQAATVQPGALPQQGLGAPQTAPQPFGALPPQSPAQAPFQSPQPTAGGLSR